MQKAPTGCCNQQAFADSAETKLSQRKGTRLKSAHRPHTKDVLGVELAGLLEGLAEDGDGGVDGVGDDADKGVGAGTVHNHKERGARVKRRWP